MRWRHRQRGINYSGTTDELRKRLPLPTQRVSQCVCNTTFESPVQIRLAVQIRVSAITLQCRFQYHWRPPSPPPPLPSRAIRFQTPSVPLHPRSHSHTLTLILIIHFTSFHNTSSSFNTFFFCISLATINSPSSSPSLLHTFLLSLFDTPDPSTTEALPSKHPFFSLSLAFNWVLIQIFFSFWLCSFQLSNPRLTTLLYPYNEIQQRSCQSTPRTSQPLPQSCPRPRTRSHQLKFIITPVTPSPSWVVSVLERRFTRRRPF